MNGVVYIKIKRKLSQNTESFWETFQVDYKEKMNVISALMDVQRNPVNTDGKDVSPPTWDAACLEEVCGSCTMYVNGVIRQACSALIEDVAEKKGENYYVTLEPMKKYPVIRDLQVNRSRMFENLIKVKGWVPIDGSYDLGMGQAQDDSVRQFRYALSRCMTCGCCMEACPQVSEKSEFIGPNSIGQALLFNMHPVGKSLESDRLDELTSPSGVSGCGNAQNCVKACPKGIPLTEAIAQINRDTTTHSIKKWIGIKK